MFSGLSTAKGYTLSLFNNSGTKIKEIRITGQTGVDIDATGLQHGIYLLEVYDNTKSRMIGTMTLLK